MKLKLFEAGNLDFRKPAPSSRSEQVKASMGEWENQEEINQTFRDLARRELNDPANIKFVRDGNKYIDLNHLSSEAFKCTNFSDMFNWRDIGQTWGMAAVDVSQWDVSRGRDFSFMFTYLERFNCDLSKWDVSNGVKFHRMFSGCHNFNSDLSNWDVSQGEDFSGMFYSCYNFNSDLSKWDVSRGRDFIGMFNECLNFNSDLSNWDVSNGVGFSWMFENCHNFNSDLSNWDVSDSAMTSGMLEGCPIEENFKPKKLQNI